MRIYFDSNIFRKLKPTSNQFRQDVTDATAALKPLFIFPFSEAHLNDLSTSTEQHRNDDLKLMEEYVHDNFIHRDAISKELKYELDTPSEAYERFNYSTSSNLSQDMDNLFQELSTRAKMGRSTKHCWRD